MQLIHLFLSFRDIFSTVHALIGQTTHVLFKKQKNVLWKHAPTADPQHFSLIISLNYFHPCFYNSIATRRTCFIFLLQNTEAKKKETTCFLLDYQNLKSFFSHYHCVNSSCAISVSPSTYWNTIFNQSARFFLGTVFWS